MRPFLLFLLTALCTTVCLDVLLPPLRREAFRVKQEHFSSKRKDDNVLVFGSSMTYRGFDPEVFDRENAEHGYPTRTFNFALPGTRLSEICKLLEQVAVRKPAKVRLVLVEADRIARWRDQAEYLTTKYIAYHDLETFAAKWEYLGGAGSDPALNLGARWRSGVATAYHLLGVGRGLYWIEDWIGVGASEAQQLDWVGPRGDGFFALDWARDPQTLRRRRAFERNVSAHERDLRRMPLKAIPSEAPASALPFFQRIREAAAGMGAKVVFFTYRGGYLGAHAHGLSEAGELPDALHFADAKRFPELFDAALSFDGKHLNERGARLFTASFARELRSWLRRSGS